MVPFFVLPAFTVGFLYIYYSYWESVLCAFPHLSHRTFSSVSISISFPFTLYTSESFTIIRRHLPTAHSFADDTQLCIVFKPSVNAAQEIAIAAMEACLRDIRVWMITDKLMINGEKTEFMLIETKAQLAKVKNCSFTIQEDRYYHKWRTRRKLRHLVRRRRHHITKTCRSSFYHLHNIRRMRKYLDRNSTEELIHAFITSRLDDCNALLYGLPSNAIAKLQRVQNAAVRVLLCVPRYCHISPLLRHLHWLPVEFMINYNIVILTFKIIHGTAPKYLSELISFKSNSHYGLRSNNQQLLFPPKVKTLATLGDRALVAAAPNYYYYCYCILTCLPHWVGSKAFWFLVYSPRTSPKHLTEFAAL